MGSSQSTPTHSGLAQYDNCFTCDPTAAMAKFAANVPLPPGTYNKSLPTIPANLMQSYFNGLLVNAKQGDIWNTLPLFNGLPMEAGGIASGKWISSFSVCDNDPVTRIVTIHGLVPTTGPSDKLKISLSGIAAKTKYPRQIMLTRVKDQFGQAYPDTAITMFAMGEATRGAMGFVVENQHMLYTLSIK